ncbi:glycosyltransferase family 4 protein [Actinoplanes regularis]|uniref:Glycosyltransferase involved in cell wall bisynthesis n=1 Tax=Actinoplanes regularis TaxID=52697 RepID=A0A238UT12_9ACTN|nr:glycosyltransferase family 4 protein [Actinoplanes regularis]GIE84470.1 N-acetylglucosaminyl-phosphatidylinositol biosynthetic protein Spt14 [Actinoplanes regularis]SNR25061.1 Glycosyltransferase involved in cell wall bisynthesis [Actinoplanes regularis]
MRIGVVSNAYHPDIGGVETHVRRLCAGLAAAGDDVEVLTQHAVRSTETVDGVLVRRFPLTVPARDYRISLPLWRWVREHAEEYDILHTHSYHALVSLGATRGRHRTPLVFTPHYHGTGHTRVRAALHPVYRPLGRRIMSRAGRIVCVTGAERDLVLQDFPETAGRVVIIPNGTDPRPVVPGKRSGVRGILCVGRLEHYKRVDRVIRAVASLGPAYRLDVVGDGPAASSLKQLAGRLGVAGRVVFHGRIDDAAFAGCLARASVAVSASTHEAFGMTMADALAAGIPTVAAPIPAHRELAAMAGGSAWVRLVDPEDESALADALRAAAAAGRSATAAPLPTWDDVVTATREVYSAITGMPAPGTVTGAGGR